VQVASSNGNVYFNLNYSLNQWYINFINEILPISNFNFNFANLMPGKLTPCWSVLVFWNIHLGIYFKLK